MDTFIADGNVNCSYCGAIYNSLTHAFCCPECGKPTADLISQEVIDKAKAIADDPDVEFLTQEEFVAKVLEDDGKMQVDQVNDKDCEEKLEQWQPLPLPDEKDLKIIELTEECERLRRVIAEIQEVNDFQESITETTTNNNRLALEPIRRDIIDKALAILRDKDTQWIAYDELIVKLDHPWPNGREEDVIWILWEAKFGMHKPQ